MDAASRLWCTDVDRSAVRSANRLHRLLAAGAYGFSVASESDARYLLRMLDEERPYANFLVACDAPVRPCIMHPNFAVAFQANAAGVRGFRRAIASGTNAVLSGSRLLPAMRAYMSGLRERHGRGFPLFMVRGVFVFEHLGEADVAALQHYFRTSAAFAEMRPRGARMPLLATSKAVASYDGLYEREVGLPLVV